MMFFFFVFIFSACQKVEYVEPIDNPISGITLKAGVGGASITGDTITVEVKRQVAFRIEFSFLNPTNVSVTTNTGSIPVEDGYYFQTQWTQTGIYWLKVSAIDAGSQLHQKTFQVKVLA